MNIYMPAHNQKEIHTVGGSLADFISPTPNRTDSLGLSTETVRHKPSSDTRLYPRNQNLNSLFFVRLRISQKKVVRIRFNLGIIQHKHFQIFQE